MATPLKVSASHAAGAELIYEWVADSTYRFYFKFYRDCSGVPEGNVVTLCYRNKCNNFFGSMYLQKYTGTLPNGEPNGTPVSNGCPGAETRCTNTTSQIPGYREWWYTGTYTLPSRCSLWVFSASISARNSSVNISGQQNLYIEATLNNIDAQGNSSPYFTVKPVPYVCVGKPYTYNNGGADKNNDSLDFQVINPKTASSCNGTPIDVPLPFANPPYVFPGNPFQTNNTFTISNTTGQINFTPGLYSSHTITVLVREYRAGKLIGSVMRDVQIQALNCNSTQPTVDLDPNDVKNTTINGGQVFTCPGKSIKFCFDVTSVDTEAVLKVEDNHNLIAPGSSVSYTGIETDSVRGCFTWMPSTSDVGLKIFTVTVKDSSCKPPGILFSQTLQIPIYILGDVKIITDTTICIDDSAHLEAKYGTVYKWNVLPGGSSVTSLSCNNCKDPYAKPKTTTTYVIETDHNAFCGQNLDTATVTVKPRPPQSIASSNSPLCEFDTLVLKGTTVNVLGITYSWNAQSGFTADKKDTSINTVNVPDSGYYYLRTYADGCYSYIDSIRVRVYPHPPAPVVTANSPVCEGDIIELRASQIDSATYKWSGPNGFNTPLREPDIYDAKFLHSGTYSVAAFFIGRCSSDTVDVSVTVNPKVTADILPGRDTFCQYDSTLMMAIVGSNPTTAEYAWDFDDSSEYEMLDKSKYIVRWDTKGERTIYLNVQNLNCKDADTQKVFLLPSPYAYFQLNDNACVDKQEEMRPYNDYVSEYFWDYDGADVKGTTAIRSINLLWTTPGVKTVTLKLKGENGCFSKTYVHDIHVHDYPEAKIVNVSANNICNRDTVVFSGAYHDGYKYFWSPQPYFLRGDSSVAIATVQQQGNIYLKARDLYGCESADSVYMTTRPCCDIAFPDAFTPNGDGHNDKFRIITVGHHDIVSFRVFNRWGQIIYNSVIEAEGWDGTIKGTPADMGTYYYTIKYKCTGNETFEKKGSFVLIR